MNNTATAFVPQVGLAALMLLAAACTGSVGDPAQTWNGTPNADATASDGQAGDESPTPDDGTPDVGPPDASPDVNPPDASPDGTPDVSPPDVNPPDVPPDVPVGCPDDLTFFETQIWNPIVSVDCANCHAPTGLAGNTRMVFEQDMTMAQRMEAMRAVAEDTSVGDVPMLLLKPTTQVLHGGFQRFIVDDSKYNAMVELIHRYETPDSCEGIQPPDVLCSFDGTVNPGATPFRRLSSGQIANTIEDLLWPGIDLGEFIPHTDPDKAYRTWPKFNIASQTMVDRMFDTAEFVAAQAVATPSDLIGCAPDSGDISSGCITTFITEFGLQAFRRPLVDEEVAGFETLAAAAPDQTSATVLGMLVEAFLQSPQFLYLDDTGGPVVPGQSDIQELDHYAVASRLSYMLWNTAPDQELLDLAASGQLQTPSVIEEQVDRLLADERGRRGILAFHEDWMRVGHLPNTKDTSLFPSYDAAMRDAMGEEIRRFVEHVVFDGTGRFAELMTSTQSVINSDLADHVYNVPGSSSGPNDWQLTDLGAQRPGILTRAQFLASNAGQRNPSQILRGVQLVERLFCQYLSPPPDAETNLPDPQPGESPKDIVAAHRADPACASCHDQIDPLGFAFEHFDAQGGWRDTYLDGNAIDATGFMTNPAGDFDGANELIDLLMTSAVVRNCYATEWFTYAVGRANDNTDVCALTDIHQRFAQSQGDIRDLIVGLALTDAFRYRVDKDLQELPSE